MTRRLRIALACLILLLTAGLWWVLSHLALAVLDGGRWLAHKVTVKE